MILMLQGLFGGGLTYMMMMGWTDGGARVYLINCNDTFILFK